MNNEDWFIEVPFLRRALRERRPLLNVEALRRGQDDRICLLHIPEVEHAVDKCDVDPRLQVRSDEVIITISLEDARVPHEHRVNAEEPRVVRGGLALVVDHRQAADVVRGDMLSVETVRPGVLRVHAVAPREPKWYIEIRARSPALTHVRRCVCRGQSRGCALVDPPEPHSESSAPERNRGVADFQPAIRANPPEPRQPRAGRICPGGPDHREVAAWIHIQSPAAIGLRAAVRKVAPHQRERDGICSEVDRAAFLLIDTILEGAVPEGRCGSYLLSVRIALALVLGRRQMTEQQHNPKHSTK